HDITTALTGVYGSRSGIPVANSYRFFQPNGSVGFSSSFLYWTSQSADGKPQFINELGKIAPAPWVPYTTSGCDFGAFSTANIEFESIPQDVDTVFGLGSPESNEAADVEGGPPVAAITTTLRRTKSAASSGSRSN